MDTSNNRHHVFGQDDDDDNEDWEDASKSNDDDSYIDLSPPRDERMSSRMHVMRSLSLVQQ